MSLKLVMTLLVRDEADIVRQNIEFHLAHGVDHVIATDNGSADETREILAEFERAGVATVLDEPGRNYAQAKWVTRMALMARDELGADWILNNDADEFWVSPTGHLKSELVSTDVDELVCTRRNMLYAFDADDGAPWPERLIYRVASPIPVPQLNDWMTDPLPCPYFYLALPEKVLLRAAGLEYVDQGNHGARYSKAPESRPAAITIFHFPVRSAAQFRRKVLQGGAAYAQNTDISAQTGWHWRRWYRKFDREGFYVTMADALPSMSQLESDHAAETVVQDLTMMDALRRLKCPT
jgi:Glycosyl transferase family 2